MGALISIQGRLGGVDFISRALNRTDQRIQIIDDKRRVCLARSTKIRLDAEVELYIPSLEPGAAAFCQVGRLRDFSESQLRDIKGTRLIFFTGGHGNLNVVNGKYCHSFTVNLRKVVMPYGSTGSPASAQAANPPSKASTRR